MIIASNFFFRGFTKFSRADYLAYKAENKILPDGVNAKVRYITFSHMSWNFFSILQAQNWM